jgi:hypothetical protein
VLYAGSPEVRNSFAIRDFTLYTKQGLQVLPGALFTSTAKKSGPAKLSNLAVAVASVSVEY